MSEEKKYQKESFRETVRGLAVYTSASILGPIVLFLGIGFFLDNYFHRKLVFKLIFLGIAFIVTNIFLLKKTRMLKKKMEQDSLDKNEK